MELDTALRSLAARQHAVVAVRQALDLGLTSDQVAHRVARGEWSRFTPRVLKVTGSPLSDRQRLMAAILHVGPDTFVSHDTALALWGVPGFALFPAHVTRRRPGRTQRLTDVVVHTTTDLGDQHVAVTDGLPVTTPMRAVFDIAGTAHPARVERALDSCWGRRLLDHRVLHRTVRELARRGRPGSAILRQLAEARPEAFHPPESHTEARLNELLARDGQARLTRQVDVGDDENWLGRVDLVDLGALLLVEVQSELFHGSVLDQRLDAARLQRLREAGWHTLEVWESTVWHRPDRAVAAVRDARLRARSTRPAA